MASILAIDDIAGHWSFLTGHTVTYAASTATTAALGTAWGAGKDLIILHNSAPSTEHRDWVLAKWAAGVPLLLSGVNTQWPIYTGLSDATIVATSSSSQIVEAGTSHPAMGGYTGTLTVAASNTFHYIVRGPAIGDGAGKNATRLSNSPAGVTGTGAAWEVGGVLLTPAGKVYGGATVPSRTIHAGWTNRTNFTATGLAILVAHVEWLLESVGPVEVTASGPSWVDDLVNGGGSWSTPTEEGVVYTPSGTSVSAAPSETVSWTAASSDPDAYTLVGATSWSHTFPGVPVPPVVPPPATYIPEVLVDGIEADVDTVRVQSDTPAHLAIPPRPGNIAGAEADLTWNYPVALSTQAEQPWHGDFRPTPGATVTIDVPGPDGVPFRAFTGVLDTTNVTLGGAPLQSSCVDPLVDTNAEFSAPALTYVMPNQGAHTSSTRLFVNAMTIWYVERALAAIGCRSTVPVTPNTVGHQSMAGSAQPEKGRLLVSGRSDASGGHLADVPYFQSFWDGSGRVGCYDAYSIGLTDAWGGGNSKPWTIAHELDPDATGVTYRVRVYNPTWSGTPGGGPFDGFGIRVSGSSVNLQTWDAAGAETVRATAPRGTATRVLVKFDPSSGTLAMVLDDAPTTVHSVTGLSIPSLTSATARWAVWDSTGVDLGGAVGAVSVYRDGPAIADDPFLLWPRRAAFHIPPTNRELWRLHVHPPISGQKAVAWVTEKAHAEQALLWTDHNGTTHWADVRGFDDQPSVWEITDAVVTGGSTPLPVKLDDLSHAVGRPAPYSRVRVKGLRGSTTYSYYDRAHREAVRAQSTVKIEAGDDPLELWLTAEDGRFWFGHVDTSLRIAGGAFGTDFERLRGSWYGGHVTDSSGSPLRWAGTSDISCTVEEVGFDAVKVTLTPGPGLAAGETFINLPLPSSPGLEDYPEVRNAPLPVLTAWAVTPVVEIEGTSTDIGASTYPEYVHDAGYSTGFVSGPRTPTVMAQAIADRHLNHVGQVMVTCEAAPVRIGQRGTVTVSGVADLVMDAVVIGVPSLEARAGQASMQLRLWVLSVSSVGA